MSEERSDRSVVVRPMTDEDVAGADRLMRRSFGTYLKVPDPESTFGSARYIGPRFTAFPAGSWVAERNGELAGSVQATRWGTFAFFGPLTVREDLWDGGIAKALLVPVIDAIDGWGVRLSGLHTFAQSAKHVGLYQSVGYWPQYLTAIMSAPVGDGDEQVESFAGLDPAGRARALDAARDTTDRIFDGLDVSNEVAAVFAQSLGDTVLVEGGAGGLAVCHVGAGEADEGVCFVKFAAVRPGQDAPRDFDSLLEGVFALARSRAATRVVAGMNLARTQAYRQMRSRGFLSGGQGVRMHRPDDLGYCRSDVFVIDDLR